MFKVSGYVRLGFTVRRTQRYVGIIKGPTIANPVGSEMNNDMETGMIRGLLALTLNP